MGESGKHVSVFYGLLLTTAGISCSIAPQITTNVTYSLATFIIKCSYETVVNFLACVWLSYLLFHIVQDSEKRKKFKLREKLRKFSSASAFSGSYFGRFRKRSESKGSFTYQRDVVSNNLENGGVAMELTSNSNTASQIEIVNVEIPTSYESNPEIISRIRSVSQVDNELALGRSTYQTDFASQQQVRDEEQTPSCIHLSSDEAACPSFYMRIGELAFCVAAVIHTSFFIMTCFEQILFCDLNYNWVRIWVIVIFLTRDYIFFAQAYLILKHSKISIIKRPTLARFAMMHLIGMNLYEWFDAVGMNGVYSIRRLSYVNNSEATTIDVTFQQNTETCEFFVKIYIGMIPYFTPFFIEYGLVAVVSCYIIYSNIGFKELVEAAKETKASRKVARSRFSVDCSKSLQGLVAGAVLITFAFILLVIIFAKFQFIVVVYYASLDLILLLTLLGNIIALRKMLTLSFVPIEKRKKFQADIPLLLVALSGALLYAVIVLLGTFAQSDITLCTLQLILALLIISQAICQTYLLFESENRRCRTAEERSRMPGKGAIMFLLLANLSLWIIISFVPDYAVFDHDWSPFYHLPSFAIILSITKPLMMFFRFHSTASLSEVWRHVYSAKKRS